MAWPLIFLAAGGAAYAARGAMRLIMKSRGGAPGGPLGAPGGPLGAPSWASGLYKKAELLKQQIQFATRDMKGFESPMTRAEAYQILRLG